MPRKKRRPWPTVYKSQPIGPGKISQRPKRRERSKLPAEIAELVSLMPVERAGYRRRPAKGTKGSRPAKGAKGKREKGAPKAELPQRSEAPIPEQRKKQAGKVKDGWIYLNPPEFINLEPPSLITLKQVSPLKKNISLNSLKGGKRKALLGIEESKYN